MKKLAISILLLNLLAACASDKPHEAMNTAASDAPVATAAVNTAIPAQVSGDDLNNPNSILAKRSVYYPLDVAEVQDADKPVVQAHAKYLGEHANRAVRLEGNCDERGSNEYNLALGQRRADGVKKMLELGAPPSRLRPWRVRHPLRPRSKPTPTYRIYRSYAVHIARCFHRPATAASSALRRRKPKLRRLSSRFVSLRVHQPQTVGSTCQIRTRRPPSTARAEPVIVFAAAGQLPNVVTARATQRHCLIMGD